MSMRPRAFAQRDDTAAKFGANTLSPTNVCIPDARFAISRD